MTYFKILFQLVFVAGVLLLSVNTAQAQLYEEEPQNIEDNAINPDHDRILKLRPLDIDRISFAFEKLRSSRVANELGLSYIYRAYFKNSGFLPEEEKVNGFGVRMSQRHYTSKKRQSPFGFYHGPVFGYQLLIFKENVFGLQDLPPSDPNYRFVGRLYQNSLDLAYQIGWQFKLGRHFTTELGAGLGGRVKYARSVGADELLTENIIGHAVVAERNSAVFLMPLPLFNFSVGYSF
ncbi:ABC transporter ATP-binding protein [Pontibacter sp. H249]|uniref:ABC transporter ATP-binding protein n=1 Tax=Pontibacter sp. H249 TaxID=3133420 RepID=UPI0030BA9EC4